MTTPPAPPTVDPDAGEAGTLVVEGPRFAIVPEWMIDSPIPDAGFRLYSLLLRYGNSSGTRMPSRATLAHRLRRSVDAVDRALRQLVEADVVRVEHRRCDGVFLANRYHVRTSVPVRKGWPHICGYRREPDRRWPQYLRLPVAAELRRGWPQICGPTQRILPRAHHLLPGSEPSGPRGDPRRLSRTRWRWRTSAAEGLRHR